MLPRPLTLENPAGLTEQVQPISQHMAEKGTSELGRVCRGQWEHLCRSHVALSHGPGLEPLGLSSGLAPGWASL